MRRWLAALCACLTLSCTATPAADGFPVIKAPIAGQTLSCKGTQCCWPWRDHDPNVVICLRPIEGGAFGASGFMIVVRGTTP